MHIYKRMTQNLEEVRAVEVWIDVDPRSGVPIYVQIVDQVCHALDVGGLRPGERLPTVRQLAGELAIAPNTIVKAYNELQRRGLVVSRPGVGTVVAEGVEEVARERRGGGGLVGVWGFGGGAGGVWRKGGGNWARPG